MSFKSPLQSVSRYTLGTGNLDDKGNPEEYFMPSAEQENVSPVERI